MEKLTKPPQKFQFVSDETVLELFEKHKSNIQKGQEKLHWYRYIEAKYKIGMETAFSLADLQRHLELKGIVLL